MSIRATKPVKFIAWLTRFAGPRYTSSTPEFREIGLAATDPEIVSKDIADITVADVDVAYRYAQNDFQPIPGRPSASMGDIIEASQGEVRRYFRVCDLGFKEMRELDLDTLGLDAYDAACTNR